MQRCMALLLGRYRDYGPDNIAKAWPSPEVALLVRMGDKIERLKNLISTDADVFGERASDSAMDLANYSVILLMLLEGRWPGVKA